MEKWEYCFDYPCTPLVLSDMDKYCITVSCGVGLLLHTTFQQWAEDDRIKLMNGEWHQKGKGNGKRESIGAIVEGDP